MSTICAGSDIENEVVREKERQKKNFSNTRKKQDVRMGNESSFEKHLERYKLSE